MSNWVDGRSKSGDRRRSTDHYHGEPSRRGIRNRADADHSPPPSRGSPPQDERRALHWLWDEVERRVQNVHLTTSDAIVITPQPQSQNWTKEDAINDSAAFHLEAIEITPTTTFVEKYVDNSDGLEVIPIGQHGHVHMNEGLQQTTIGLEESRMALEEGY
jgi:hypothetical protein